MVRNTNVSTCRIDMAGTVGLCSETQLLRVQALTD